MKTQSTQLLRNIRTWIGVFIFCLVISGVTAFPLEWELSVLHSMQGTFTPLLSEWIDRAYHAVSESNARYPFLSYGTDWLAFAHLVIAVAFIGPIKDPVKNIWVIQFGMIACIMVFPLAFICGSIRQIPIFWRLIDCSFGVIGLVPLYHVYRSIRKLEILNQQK